MSLDHIDRRILGKLRACEKRRTPFTPGLRIIAHDLTIPLMTVWRRMHKLAARGLIEIWRAPKGLRYLWRTATFWRQRSKMWYTPPETGEYSSPSVPYDVRTTASWAQKLRRDRTKDPPTVLGLTELFVNSGLRSLLPWPIRGFVVRKLCRVLVEAGMSLDDGQYLVRRARDRPALLGFWLGSPYEWKEVLGDRKMGIRRPQKRAFIESPDESVRINHPVDDPAAGPQPVSALLDRDRILSNVQFERRVLEIARVEAYDPDRDPTMPRWYAPPPWDGEKVEGDHPPKAEQQDDEPPDRSGLVDVQALREAAKTKSPRRDADGNALPWWFVKRKQEARDGGTQDAVDN